jgi:malonyl-CoA O-methyltransferase
MATRAALRRIARNAALPWLHGEIARRLIERLAPMRAEPRRIVEWWATAGGGDEVLRAAYPRAERVAVEPDAAWAARRRAAERRPWWSFGAAGALVVEESASDAEIGRAQLVWANMALHLVVDPPALFARWQRLLDIDGVVVFSCLGPGTLRELRDLYAAHGWPAPTPGFVDLHDLGDMLVDAGFADPVLDQETITLRWKSAEALLQERGLGSNTARPSRRAANRGLAPALRRSPGADADGSIGLSVEVAMATASSRHRAAPMRRSRCRSTCGRWCAGSGRLIGQYAKICRFVEASAFDMTAVAVGRGGGDGTSDHSRMSALSVQGFRGRSPAATPALRRPRGRATARCSGCCCCSMTPSSRALSRCLVARHRRRVLVARRDIVMPFASIEMLAIGVSRSSSTPATRASQRAWS